MGVTLVGLTAEELEARRPRMISGFAQDMADNFGLPIEQALTESAEGFATSLPDGVATRGQLLRRAMDGDDQVGFLWISLPGTTYAEMAWISEVEVNEDQRGRGYGSAMIRAGEADLVERGVHRVGLHVFGHNDGARRLYERLGYRVFSQAQSRPVNPAETIVTLVPMTAEDFAARRDDLIANDPFMLARDPAATPDKARRRAGLMAPDGVDSPGVFLRTAHVDGREVGWIWSSGPNPDRPTTGMIHYLTVAPELRRRGYGRAMVAAAEADQVGPTMALSVPGRPDALAFAATLGMTLGSQQMVKDLQP